MDRYLSNGGYGTRKAVRRMIRDGLVRLDGIVLTDPGLNLREDELAALTVAGEQPSIQHTHYLLLHKPAGYVTAAEDKWFPTVTELIPEELSFAQMQPVGRLDRDTTGLLLFTNDGQLAHRLISPKWEIPKTYLVTTEGAPFRSSEVTIFSAGIRLDDLICRPADLKIINEHVAELTLTEGKYHQVKRMMSATGREVVQLKRLRFANLSLTDLDEPGDTRLLNEDEINALYQAVNLSKPVF